MSFDDTDRVLVEFKLGNERSDFLKSEQAEYIDGSFINIYEESAKEVGDVYGDLLGFCHFTLYVLLMDRHFDFILRGRQNTEDSGFILKTPTGEQFRKLREKLQLTRKELGKVLGLKELYIIQFEKDVERCEFVWDVLLLLAGEHPSMVLLRRQ